MTITLNQLITPADRDAMVATLLALAASLQAPTTSWVEGDPTLTQYMTVGQKMADLSSIAVEIAKGGFGDLLPSDGWADIWALSRFKVKRIPSVAAAGGLVLTCDASAVGNTYAPGEIIVAHATTHKTYVNTESVTVVPSTTLDPKAFAADEPGTASTASPASITVLVSSLVGVTVSNPESLIGTDQETTPHLVERARSSLGALSPNGPKDAYNYVATTQFLPDGTPLSNTSTPITRTRTVVDEATGELSVYCATAAGAPSGPDIAIVQAAIDTHAEPWGTTATAIAASELVFAPVYQAWVKGSQLTATQIESAIATALAMFFSMLELGGYVIPPDTGDVYVDTIRQVIGVAVPGIQRVVITVPSTDTVLSPNQVATLGAITATITLL